MECTSAMAAVSALATGLGAFLAPQLPRMLGVLLDARALNAGPHSMAASAARARETLTSTIPPRLLLPPLYAHLPAALQVPGCYATDPVFCSIGRLSSTVHMLSADGCIAAPRSLRRRIFRRPFPMSLSSELYMVSHSSAREVLTSFAGGHKLCCGADTDGGEDRNSAAAICGLCPCRSALWLPSAGLGRQAEHAGSRCTAD